MKELLKFSKYLETDFVNADAAYQSKMDLAISSLVTGDYSKAKQLFDGAIEIDSQFPSAWLGKAFAEITLVDDDGFNSLAIDEYLTRAMRTTDDILKYKVAIAGCLAYRHAVIIKKCVVAVEVAIEEQKKAKKERNVAIAAAVAGTMFTGKDKSIGSNIVGGALIAGGASHAINSQLKANELEILGKSIYTAALGQTYLSIPIIHLCGTHESQIQDEILRANFNVVLNSWKESVTYLYNKQRDQLVERLNKLSLSVTSAESVQKLLSGEKPVEEIVEFTTFMKIIGLSGHKVFNVLNKLFNETLKNHFEHSGALNSLEVAKKKENKAMVIGFLLILVGIGSFFTKYSEWLPYSLDGVGLVVGLILLDKAKSKEMKEFEKAYKEAVNEVKTIAILSDDFNLSLIEKNSNTSNNATLGH
jgi:tetratricopeptide (TPR) repeat protein